MSHLFDVFSDIHKELDNVTPPLLLSAWDYPESIHDYIQLKTFCTEVLQVLSNFENSIEEAEELDHKEYMEDKSVKTGDWERGRGV